MKPRALWKKTAARAATATPNVAVGAATVVASAALWNPLPMILWGIGSTAWVLFASTSQKYRQRVLGEEQRKAEEEAEAERGALWKRVDGMLAQAPFVGWIQSGALPDYMSIFRRLLEIRDKVARIARERREIELVTEHGIQHQLGYMLTAYLRFIRARITYLQILAEVRIPDSPMPAPAAVPGFRPPPRQQKQEGTSSGDQGGRPPVSNREPNPLVLDVGPRLAQVDAKIAELESLAVKEPATAETRRWHVGILKKQRELIEECHRRDQSVAAQLLAFPDAFDVVLGRVSASEFNASDIESYMGTLVEQVENTSRFVEAMEPAVDEMLGRIPVAG